MTRIKMSIMQNGEEMAQHEFTSVEKREDYVTGFMAGVAHCGTHLVARANALTSKGDFIILTLIDKMSFE